MIDLENILSGNMENFYNNNVRCRILLSIIGDFNVEENNFIDLYLLLKNLNYIFYNQNIIIYINDNKIYFKDINFIKDENLFNYKYNFIFNKSFFKNIDNNIFYTSLKNKNILFKYGSLLLYYELSGTYSISDDYIDEVSKRCFSNTNIEEINILSSTNIDTIVEYAFNNCYNLKKININKKIKKILEYSFNNCKNLKSIYIDDVNIIDDNAFLNCENLLSIDLEKTNLSSIGTLTFYNCSNIETVFLPTSLKIIEEKCFDKCKKLNKINIENTSLTELNPFIFNECISLNNIKLPKTILKIDIFSFYNCNSLSLIDMSLMDPIKLDKRIFYTIDENFKIKVDKLKYDKWISENNWYFYNELHLSSKLIF